jgi:ribosomal protein S17E
MSKDLKPSHIKVLMDIGHPAHEDKFTSHKDPSIRAKVASYSRKKSTLDKLVKDPDEKVRANVAARQNIGHLDKLIKDPSEHVRNAVAGYGSPKHAQALLNDKSETVRRTAKTSADFYKRSPNLVKEWDEADKDEVPNYGEGDF